MTSFIVGYVIHGEVAVEADSTAEAQQMVQDRLPASILSDETHLVIARPMRVLPPLPERQIGPVLPLPPPT